MIKVRIFKASNYPVSAVIIRRKLIKFLQTKKLAGDTEISIALIGREKAFRLSKKYLKEDRVLHNVLSFTENEVTPKFMYPPDGKTHLGEVVVCYPKAREEAKAENKRIEEKVWELVEHGTMHLLGYHHR